MSTKIAINGFGRIGRCVLKNIISKYASEVEVVAINDLLEGDKIAHLLKYDSVYGRLEEEVNFKDGELLLGREKKIKLFQEKDPSLLPWKDMEVDIVLECTGLFTDYAKAKKHIEAGAKKVIISAPSKSPEEIPSFVLGVNEKKYDTNKHQIIDMGSCTTNCLAPVVKIINDSYEIDLATMTTIHSYTLSQNILDGPHKDMRRSRAGAINLIPTTTGAAKAISKVIPEIEGKISGMAIRVPTPTVSIVDLACFVKNKTNKEDLVNQLKEKSQKEMKGILGVEQQPLVSTDYVGNSFSCVVDEEMTEVRGNLIKILAWYDNEWGYSSRLADFAIYIKKQNDTGF